MREIRFKAFDKVMEKMYEVGYVDFPKERVQLAHIIDGICYAVYISPLKYVQLLQYTGLKDKNGMEIYEGDIIKSEENIVSKIVYDEASFKSVWVHNDHLVNCVLDNLFIRTLNPVVIGNIYENPELLKN